MNCDHDFHTVERHEVTQGGIHQWYFAIVVCAFCGEIRHLYSDGRVVIQKAGTVIDSREP